MRVGDVAHRFLLEPLHDLSDALARLGATGGHEKVVGSGRQDALGNLDEPAAPKIGSDERSAGQSDPLTGQSGVERVAFGFLPLVLAATRLGALRRDQLRHVPHFAVMSVLATAFYYLAFAKGAALLPSGMAGMLSGSIPLFTFLCALLFLDDERPNVIMGSGVLVAFVGIVLTARPWEEGAGMTALPGAAWMLAGALSVGLSFVYARRFLSPLDLPPLALAAWQTGLALIMLLALTDLSGTARILEDWKAAAGLVFGLGLLGIGLAYLLYYFILRDLGAVAASGATYIPPVVALVLGAISGEAVGLLDIVAMALILPGVTILQIGRRPARVRPPAGRTTSSARP